MSTTITLQTLLEAVTQEQIERCHRRYDLANHRYYYEVESESDASVLYRTEFIKGIGWQCSCPAGQQGFANCHYGTCKHCRWSWRHAQVYRQAMADELERVYSMPETKPTAQEIEADARRYAPRPFSLLK